jgi:hypothetical protein
MPYRNSCQENKKREDINEGREGIQERAAGKERESSAATKQRTTSGY